MKILYYDCFSGISGDMNLGALIDIGVDSKYFISEINKLSIKDEFEIKIQRKLKMGIEGTKVDVVLKHKHHHHDHDGHAHHHEHHHAHRNLNDIKEIINKSELNDNVKDLSIKMFLEVAKAEGKVHGKRIDEVHFHEVGAVDSIVDIVGAAICIDYLKVDKVYSSTVEVGGGFVKCQHGNFPVPAPATSNILTDIPISTNRITEEATTPTGAAILKVLSDKFTDNINYTIKKTGYGLGTKDFSIPNVLRVYILESNDKKDLYIREKQFMIEVNIDDMNPESFTYIENKLFELKALDVYRSSIIMKKSRMAFKLSVLCKNEDKDNIIDFLFRQTTTLGVREYSVDKIMLERKVKKVNTKYGDIRIKEGYIDGNKIKSKAEFDDCIKIAEENNISLESVYAEIRKVLDK